MVTPAARREAAAHRREVQSMFFAFPEHARWIPDRDAVEFSVILEPYGGAVTVSRRVFQRLLDRSPTPERCMEAFHLQRTRFELIVERKLRRRQLTDDGNVEIRTAICPRSARCRGSTTCSSAWSARTAMRAAAPRKSDRPRRT